MLLGMHEERIICLSGVVDSLSAFCNCELPTYMCMSLALWNLIDKLESVECAFEVRVVPSSGAAIVEARCCSIENGPGWRLSLILAQRPVTPYKLLPFLARQTSARTTWFPCRTAVLTAACSNVLLRPLPYAGFVAAHFASDKALIGTM